MKITDAKVLISSPGRNFVTLKVYTDQGIYGLGDATLNGRELAVAAYLSEHLIPCLIGRDPFQTEDIWQYLYRGAYWRKGPVTMSAISAVDVALWDIKAKALKTPLYNLLGGKSRTGVMVYGHANGRDISETLDEVGKYIANGYLAVRAQSGVPGLASTYGVSSDKTYYEPARKGLPPENLWSTEKYLRSVPKLFEALRAKHGADVHLLHDAHHRLTPIEAARLGKELEPYHLFWLEDAVTNKKKIMGFGHRVYKVKDPRATVLQELAERMGRGGEAVGNPHADRRHNAFPVAKQWDLSSAMFRHT